MKKINKFLSMILIFCLSIIGVSNFSTINVKADTLPVQLCYANYEASYSAGGGCVNGFVKVKNLAYDKKVTIHYNYNNVEWKDVQAKYYKTDNEGNDIWVFKTPYAFFGDCNFCIKCEMNGQTYWDNNDGKNYLVSSRMEAYGTNPMNLCYLKYHSTDDNKIKDFHGTLIVNKIGYQKDVIVRYTTDNWKTYKEEKAEYNKEASWGDNFERWYFTIDLDKPAENVQLAVVYKVDGKEYMDNNFGSNYDFRNWNDLSCTYNWN